MAGVLLTPLDKRLRAYIFEFIVEYARAPQTGEMASQFDCQPHEILEALHRLNEAHLLFLKPGTHEIMMAHPLSTVITDYRVLVNDRWLYANCAMDSLGIPAMIGTDALIEISLPLSKQTVQCRIVDGELKAEDNLLVHFALPVRQWYDDLVHT